MDFVIKLKGEFHGYYAGLYQLNGQYYVGCLDDIKNKKVKKFVILLIWDIFCAAIRAKNKSFNREVKRHIDEQYQKFFLELAHPHDEVIIDKKDEKIKEGKNKYSEVEE